MRQGLLSLLVVLQVLMPMSGGKPMELIEYGLVCMRSSTNLKNTRALVKALQRVEDFPAPSDEVAHTIDPVVRWGSL